MAKESSSRKCDRHASQDSGPQQAGAVPYRWEQGELQICLITTRRNRTSGSFPRAWSSGAHAGPDGAQRSPRRSRPGGPPDPGAAGTVPVQKNWAAGSQCRCTRWRSTKATSGGPRSSIAAAAGWKRSRP